MNKVIIIFGSARSEGNTKKAIDELNINKEIDLIDLNKLQISPYDYKNTNQDDDYLKLMEKILNYNVIVLATPIYWYSMSAQMKIFIDRLTDCITIRKDIGRKLEGKKLYLLASSASPDVPKGFENVFKHICQYMKMEYKHCFHHYSGSNKELIHNNNKITKFLDLINST
ncbi:MAG: flavodoxin family protein [Rickettsiales bacterium]|nr:flavodoxin family protein [Rickettsiales bacterium]